MSWRLPCIALPSIDEREAVVLFDHWWDGTIEILVPFVGRLFFGRLLDDVRPAGEPWFVCRTEGDNAGAEHLFWFGRRHKVTFRPAYGLARRLTPETRTT